MPTYTTSRPPTSQPPTTTARKASTDAGFLEDGAARGCSPLEEHPRLDDLAAQWLGTLDAVEGKAPKTISRYGDVVRSWIKTLGDNATLASLTRAAVEARIKRLHFSGQSRASLASAIIGIRSWCRWLCAHGRLTSNPTAGLLPPRVYRKTRKILSVSEVRRLVLGEGGGALPKKPRDLIFQVAFAVAYSAALRSGEIGFLLTDDVEWHEAAAIYTVRVRHAKHAHSDQVIPLGRRVSRLLGAYLELRTELGAGPYLFPAKGPRPLCQRAIALRFAALCQSRGIERKGRELTPHLLRRSRCSHLLDAPRANVRVIQQFMRHRSIETTMAHYAYSDDTRVFRMIAGRDPVDRRSGIAPQVNVQSALSALLGDLDRLGPGGGR